MTPEGQRVLLGLAAKAAGYQVTGNVDVAFPGAIEIVGRSQGHDDVLMLWNPLADDGQALRLVVALGLDILRTDQDVEAIAGLPPHAPMGRGASAPFGIELLGADPYAATRLAIVRAAAEIGRKAL